MDAVRDADGLANPMGFVPVDDAFRHPQKRDVYAEGVAIAIAPPQPTAVPAGVPKTGQMSETMAKVAAHNIVADIQGGHNGIVFKADKVLGDGDHARVMVGPQAHWAKLAFERYLLSSRKRGLVSL